MDDDRYALPRLLVRSLEPTIPTFLVEVLIAATVMGLHLFFLNRSLHQAVSVVASDQWIQHYTNFVIHPVETFSHNALLNTVLTAVVWGFIGLIIYTALEKGITIYRTWRLDQNEVRVVNSQKVELHPLRRLRLVRVLWRGLFSILLVLLVITTGSLSHHLLVQIDTSLKETHTMILIRNIIITVGVWTLLMQGFVILLRLFMFRTRLFGEIIS